MICIILRIQRRSDNILLLVCYLCHLYILQGVLSLVVLPDGRLASGSGDSTVRVWNFDSGICDRVLEGNTSVMDCVCTVVIYKRILIVNL